MKVWWLILAQVMSFSRPWSIHLLPAKSLWQSMNTLVGGCCTPDLVTGPLHSTSADLTTIFVARVKRMIEIVQPVMMCQTQKRLLAWSCRSNREFPDYAGNCVGQAQQVFCGMDLYMFARSSHISQIKIHLYILSSFSWIRAKPRGSSVRSWFFPLPAFPAISFCSCPYS